jgi:hypothetical protein
MNDPRGLFQEGFIRLTQPTALNDPFEASFCTKSLNELAAQFDETMAHDPEFGELSFSQYIEKRMHNIGVVSLSENKENLLMWAHYADEHKGLVAGISHHPMLGSIFENLFRADTYINTSWSEEYSPFDGTPKPVNYRKGLRYRNDKFDYDYSNIIAEGADRILYEVFMQKSDEWIYEQEYRVVLRLEQADRVVLKNIEEIGNDKIKQQVKGAKYKNINSKSGLCTINLNEIEDENERMWTAMELVKLSHNPETVYLMKLASSSINNCLFGLNCKLDKSNIEGGYASKTGYLDIWQATKNNDYYNLEFEQI